MSGPSVIRAAGVVLLREAPDGTQFLVVHRPGRSDWSLPKGKLDSGEHVVAAALRECDEETGYTPLLQAPLAMQHYSAQGRPKVVHYWRARVCEDAGFAPDDEVSEIRWVPVAEAASVLTYPTDVGLVESAVAMPDTTPLVILRHTQAVKRSLYKGDTDADRPLTGKGRSQAKTLVPLLEAFGITAVHSSPSRRCADTVKRLAKSLDVTTVKEPLLTEESHDEDPGAAAERAFALATLPEPLVLCSHRPVLPTIVDAMADALGVSTQDPQWRSVWDPKLTPGAFIVVHRDFSADGTARVVGVEHHALNGGVVN
jgi:8-oxo-dGTP diphosphatase